MTATTTTKPTAERRVAKLFGLEGDKWLRHANPWSVGTRFLVVPLLALSIWSRDWIGSWCLLPVALSLVFMMVNPLLFPEPRSTRNWASRGVLGERVYADRTVRPIPAAFRSRVPAVSQVLSTLGLAQLAYGLVVLDLVVVIGGILLMQTAKAWYIDRMVLLFEQVKDTDPEYAGWDY